MDILSLVSQWEKFSDEHNIVVDPLNNREKWKLQQEWRKNFATAFKGATGKWSQPGAADWGVFSDGYTPCLKGFRAEEAYRKLDANCFLVVFSNEELSAYRCASQSLPLIHELQAFLRENPGVSDIYISAPDFQWTLVLTHEQECGPYFAQRGLTDV